MNSSQPLKLPATEYFLSLILRIALLGFLISESRLPALISGNFSAEDPGYSFTEIMEWQYGLPRLMIKAFDAMRPVVSSRIFFLLVHVPGILVFLIYSGNCYRFLTARSKNIFSFILSMTLLVVCPVIASLFAPQNMYGLPLLFLLQAVFSLVVNIETGRAGFRVSALVYNLLAVWAYPYMALPVACVSLAYLVHCLYICPETTRPWQWRLTIGELLWMIPFLTYLLTLSDTGGSNSGFSGDGGHDYGIVIPGLAMMLALAVIFSMKKSPAFFMFVAAAILMAAAVHVSGLSENPGQIRSALATMLIFAGFLI